MALRMREVLARRWVGVFVPLTLSFEFTGDQIRVDLPSPLSQQLPHALFGAGQFKVVDILNSASRILQS